MSPVLKLGNQKSQSVKKSPFFFVGPPGAERVRLRPRKPITYVCGMIPDRCGPFPTRTARSGGLRSGGTRLPSVDEPLEPQWRLGASQWRLGAPESVARFESRRAGFRGSMGRRQARRGSRVTQTIAEHPIRATFDEFLLGNHSPVLLSRLERRSRALSAPGAPHKKNVFYLTLCSQRFPSFKTGLNYLHNRLYT